jgi:hypothetical protein
VMTYDTVDETYNVQKCTQLSNIVCDTVYDLSVLFFFQNLALAPLSCYFSVAWFP